MSILHSHNIAVTCCFLIFIIVNLNPISSENNQVQTENTGEVCVNEGCDTKCNKTGSYSLEIKEDCDVYYMSFDFENDASIINLTSSIQYLNQDEDWINNATFLKPTFNIKLKETTKGIPQKDESVLLEKWYKKYTDVPCVISYLSRSSKVSVEISGTGNWSYYQIKFSFNEIPYRLFNYGGAGKDRQTVPYKPNSVSLLRLETQTAWRGINISFDKLTINTEMGEYILIGTGTKPFENKYSRPLYVTQVPENSTFFVDDSSAFVAFVSGSVQNTNEYFEILWKGIEKKIDKLPDDKMGILNSSQVCFYNYSAAIAELYKNNDERFKTFRTNFSEIAKKYLPKEYEDIQLNYASTDLFGPPTTVNGALSLLIKVTHGEKSILTWRTLRSIIKKFNETITNALKVGICPEKSYDLYKDKYHIVFYALVPVFGLFGLMMWGWKHNLFAQKCMPEKEEKLTFGHVPAEPNTYATTTTTTTPKLRYEEGRSEAFIQNSAQQEDREGANETMIEINAIPSTSQEQNTLARYLSSKRSKSRPSIQSLLDSTEENNKRSQNEGKGNESDHLYDSVSSSKQLHETKL